MAFRNRLLLQAAITALVALTGSSGASGWTIPTLVVAAGAVFVGMALRPEPQWRTITIGFEAVAVGFGLLGLVAGHYVPGTIVGGWTLAFLLSGPGAAAFAGTPAETPSWAPATTPEPYGAEAAAPVQVPVPVAAVVPELPVAVPEQPVPVVAVAVPEQPAPVVAVPEPAPVVAVAVPEQPAPVVAVPEPAPPVVPPAPRTRPAALTVLPGK
jgi:hypothetical protein